MSIIRTLVALGVTWLIMVATIRPATAQFFGPSGPMSESFLATLAADLDLGAEQRAALTALHEQWEAELDAELGAERAEATRLAQLARARYTGQGRTDEQRTPLQTEAMQAGTLEELMAAGRQAVDAFDQRAAGFEDRFFARLHDILTDVQRERLVRWRRGRDRYGLASSVGANVPPGNVDPFAVLMEILRERPRTAGAGAGADADQMADAAMRLGLVLPPDLAGAQAWLDAQEIAYVAELRSLRAIRHRADAIRWRVMDLGNAASTASDADVSARLDRQRREATEAYGRIRLAPNREMAAFVRQFVVAAAEHLPEDVVAELEERVLTKAYGVLHRDPISMIPAMEAFANDASVDLAYREELLARLPALRERHARLNRELRATEDERRLSAMRSGPDVSAERIEFMWRIATLLEERQAVNLALRAIFTQRVPAEIRERVLLPRRTERDVDRLIDQGYQATRRERPEPDPEPDDG